MVAKAEKPLELLEGQVEKILFSNPENFYTVASLKPAGSAPSSKLEYVIVGNLASLQPQEVVRLEGHWINDKRYGRQFKVESYTSVLPSSTAAMEKYLGSGLIKGIGKAKAKLLVEAFGTDIFEVIENEPERLSEIKKIGPKLVEQIKKGWSEHRAMREIMMFLQQYGIPQGMASRIYKHYGDEALQQIRKNPYQLALEVRGIGFKSADAIAMKLGIPVESLERCKAGVHFLMQDLASDGHTYFPADPLIAKAVDTLGVEESLIIQAVNELAARKNIVLEVLPDGTRAIFLSYLHRHELGVAEHLDRVLSTGKLYPKMEAVESITQFEEMHHFHLAENQKLAVADALKGGVLVITGGPGTGKTTIIRTILRILESHGVTSILAAPTGRAAKRMQELTNIPASTIHRLLQYSPQEGKYLRNPQNPIRADFLIIDESSMIDIALAHSLLRATASTSSRE